VRLAFQHVKFVSRPSHAGSTRISGGYVIGASVPTAT
jgi:hypothetical protein